MRLFQQKGMRHFYQEVMRVFHDERSIVKVDVGILEFVVVWQRGLIQRLRMSLRWMSSMTLTTYTFFMTTRSKWIFHYSLAQWGLKNFLIGSFHHRSKWLFAKQDEIVDGVACRRGIQSGDESKR